MARITRKELKSDRFAQEVAHSVQFLGEHRRQFLRYGAIAAVVVALIVAFMFYRSHQRTVRQEALSEALRIDQAPVGEAAAGQSPSFPTEEAREIASMKAFAELADRFPGTQEAYIARYFQGSKLAAQGSLAEAERHLKEVADNADRDYASLAQLSLAEIYFASARDSEGEKVLRALIDRPTRFVSREQATVSLARGLARTNPAEARKLLEPLRTSRSAVSQVAIQMYGELGAQ